MNIILNGDISDKEIENYRLRAISKYPNRIIKEIELTIDGDFVDIQYDVASIPFERIRRLTGYLSTMPKINSAKQAEINDRVIHEKGTT